MINGPTLDFFREKLPHCPEAREQIFKLNEVIERVCKIHSEKFAMVDINDTIRSLDDVTDYIFHLKAYTAFKLFIKTASALTSHFAPPPYRKNVIYQNISDVKPCMLHKVLNSREVLIFGKNFFELVSTYYDLLLGGVKDISFTYHKIGEVGNIPFDLKDFTNYYFKNDQYYIVVADNENYLEIRELLIKHNYQPLKDFVQFKPTPYTKVWRE